MTCLRASSAPSPAQSQPIPKHPTLKGSMTQNGAQNGQVTQVQDLCSLASSSSLCPPTDTCFYVADYRWIYWPLNPYPWWPILW